MLAINFIHEALASIGRSTLGLFATVGRLMIFAAVAVSHMLRAPFYPRELATQLLRIGYFSLPVVGLTTLFTGGALALQIAESVVPAIVAIGMVRELGPVLAGLMVAGRVGASIAAEIGTMKVTEQIDALTTLSTNPIKYLVVPRILAATIAMPLLVFIGNIIGILGVFRLDFNAAAYITNTVDFLETGDMTSGLIKAAVFGFIVALMGTYSGFNSGRGAQGVGQATTNAVVSASVLILSSNYLLTELLFPA